MKTLLIAVAAVLMFSSTAWGGWYVGPTVGYAYYPAAPVYAYPAPPVYAYPAPVVVARPRVVYSPIIAPAPVWVGRPVVVGPAGRAYIVGRPVRNTVRAVLPY
jgi:hypothetical protein